MPSLQTGRWSTRARTDAREVLRMADMAAPRADGPKLSVKVFTEPVGAMFTAKTAPKLDEVLSTVPASSHAVRKLKRWGFTMVSAAARRDG